jgi:hypothetical protein
MMEFFWWIRPLFLTGLALVAIAYFLALLFPDSKICERLVVILSVPFFVSIVSAVVYGLVLILSTIWSPYF